MKYLFQVTSLDADTLHPQVSAALETRTQLLSRARTPGLWKYIDKRSAASKTKARSKSSGISARLRGAVFLVLGILLMIPSLMKPEELPFLLLAGLIATAWGVSLLRGKRPGEISMDERFDRAAETLLTHMAEALDTHSFQVECSDSGLTFTTESASSGIQSDTVAYNELEFIIETEDLFLVTYQRQAVLLPKAALVTASFDEFHSFLSQRTSVFPALTAQERM